MLGRPRADGSLDLSNQDEKEDHGVCLARPCTAEQHMTAINLRSNLNVCRLALENGSAASGYTPRCRVTTTSEWLLVYAEHDTEIKFNEMKRKRKKKKKVQLWSSRTVQDMSTLAQSAARCLSAYQSVCG